jgi:hypothetical protein
MATLILDEFWLIAKSKQGEEEISGLQEYLDSCRPTIKLKHTAKR